MLLKIGETVFINTETIMAVENFYSDSIEEDNDELFEEVGDYDDEEEFDEDENNINFQFDSKSRNDFEIDRLDVDLDVLEFQLKNQDFMRIGTSLVNYKKISMIDFNEKSAQLIIRFESMDLTWDLGDYDEKEVKELFHRFQIAPVVK